MSREHASEYQFTLMWKWLREAEVALSDCHALAASVRSWHKIEHTLACINSWMEQVLRELEALEQAAEEGRNNVR